MRTTLIVPDPIFVRAKAFARAHGQKLSELFSEAVAERLARAEQAVAEKPAVYRVKPRAMGKPRVDLDDREALLRAMEEEG
jgi:hypothetical protein